MVRERLTDLLDEWERRMRTLGSAARRRFLAVAHVDERVLTASSLVAFVAVTAAITLSTVVAIDELVTIVVAATAASGVPTVRTTTTTAFE